MFTLMADAIRTDIGDGQAKWLLVVLADHANEQHQCWPSIQTLASRTEMSESTIKRKLRVLRDAGLLTWQTRHDTSNLYTISQLGSDRPMVQSDPTVGSERPTNQSRTSQTKKEVPEGWQPSDDLVASIDEVYRQYGWRPDHVIETDKFVAHHRAKGSRFKRIDQAYRNWIGNAFKFSAVSGGGSSRRGGKPVSGERQSDKLRRVFSAIGG